MTGEHEVDLEALPDAPSEDELKNLYPEEPPMPEGEFEPPEEDDLDT
jgi:hypothetical protein